MSKGPSEATSTSSTVLPQYAQDAQQNLIKTGQSLTSNLTGQNPLYGVAGFNPDQLTAFDQVRNMVDDSNTNPFANLGQSSFNAADPNAGGMATAAQVSPGEIQAQMNPFLQSALTPTLDNMRTQHNQDVETANAKLTAGHAYGGSRQAVADSLMSKSFDAQVAQTAGTLMAQGYDKATATAMANAQMRQQASLQNASTANNMSLQNASMANNMSAQNASNQLQAANLNQTQKMQALQALLSSGNQQQAQQQSGIDAPMKALQALIGTTPSLNNTGSNTTTTQPVQDNTLSTILGAGLMLAKLSDETEKTDIKKLGTDNSSGLDIFAYRYKGDPKTYPKMVGPMAQQILEKYPESVTKVGGKLTVDYSALKKLIEAA